MPGDLFPEFRNGKRVQALQSVLAQKISVLAANGIQFDLSSRHWKLIATVPSSLAEFERDPLRERVRSDLAAAKARGKILADRKAFTQSDQVAPKLIRPF